MVPPYRSHFNRRRIVEMNINCSFLGIQIKIYNPLKPQPTHKAIQDEHKKEKRNTSNPRIQW